MRQKEEKEFAPLLSRIRLGHITDADIQVLEKRKLHFSHTNVDESMKEVIKVLSTLLKILCVFCLPGTCTIN